MAGPESTYQSGATWTAASDETDQDLGEAAEKILRELANLGQTPAFEGARVREMETLTDALIVTTQVLAREKGGEIEEISRRLSELRASLSEGPVSELPGATASLDVVFRALRLNTMLLMMLSSIGECRMETPYSRLRPVIKSDGTRVWCCSHKQEHCS
jgi:hypothetical protein